MEHCMKQNTAINIYEHYFDDIVPTGLVLPRGVRYVAFSIKIRDLQTPI